MSYNVQDIANKIILNTDVERGDVISNLKLQKLLYYMQGYHYAFFDAPLFDDSIEAWMYGPVVPDVYHRFKENGSLAIVLDPLENKEIELKEDEEDMFRQVMAEYGKFSAVKLMDMTHQEQPWKEAFPKNNKVINPETMKSFFKTMIVDE